ncbi:MAG: putative toxin-antitoxin system toxin component, PIN family [Nanoarchaeota archaeon]|nr:putative toxin-antitoxin system toxin component, PIN family [Nanoarchaeota archaeon]
MKAVLDTNVFVSGNFWEKGPSGKVLDAWRDGKFAVVSSIFLVEELIRVLNDFKIQAGRSRIEEIRKTILDNSLMVDRLAVSVEVVKDDPSDNKFLEAAIAGGAGFVVSQDKHLLKIKEYAGIRIITPSHFLEILNK